MIISVNCTLIKRAQKQTQTLNQKSSMLKNFTKGKLLSGTRKSPLFMLIFLMLFCGQSFAQEQTVSGSVKDETGSGLPGVNVLVKGTTVGTTTDTDGNFVISAPRNSTLVFSFIGYQVKEVQLQNQSRIEVQLETDVTSLEEVVVTGYYAQKKSDLTGSVGVVDAAEMQKTATYDVAKMLQGQVAGVTVQSSGEPGGFVNIKIRGATSFTNNNPLFVVDGIIVDGPFDLATTEIESVQVLKDATSAAIYGVRGANGVIVITTKKGSNTGKLSVGYKGYMGVQHVPKKIPLTDRVGYQNITNAAYLNSGQGVLPGNDPTNSLFIDNVDTDWQDEAYRTGKIQNHSFTFSGGAQALSYSMNVDYFKNTSYLKTPQLYERLNTALNLTGQTGKFKYGSKISYTQSDKENFNEYLAGTSSMISLLQAIPTMPVYDADRLGGYGGADNLTQRAITLNVIGYNNLIDNASDRNRFIGNIWGEFEILKGLKYTLRASADRLDWYNRYFNAPHDLGWYYINTEEEATLDVTNGNAVRTVVDNMLTYELQLDKHKLDVFAGHVMERFNDYRHFSRGTGYEVGEIGKLQYAANRSAEDFEAHDTRLSYLGRLNYMFDDRYLLTATFRRDGSSRFRPENNKVNSYSVSAAWKIHNDFALPKLINSAKLRVGYGTLPNNTIGFYGYEAVVNPFAGYTFNNTLAPGTTVVELKDPNIRWELVTTANAALDLTLLDGKIDFTGEYYVKTAHDLLATVPLPYSTGSFPASIVTNAGEFENRGFEFTLAYHKEAGDFKYDVSANFGTLKNEVKQIGQFNLPIMGANSKTEVGRSVGELYAYVTEGLFQTQEEIDNHAVQSGAKPGDVRFKDVNKDGFITDEDRVYQGSSIPKVSYGLNFSSSYKNFDLSLFFQGHAGNKVYNATYNSLMIGGLLNHHEDMLDYWTPENTDTNIPRPDVLETNQNARPSDRFIEKGDFARLQNFQLGYTVALKGQKVLQRARVYVSGQNVFTISGYRGYDPDFMNDGLFSRGFDYGSFPNPRTFMLGVELGF
jgi:TonB-dependent starch-binding outer membrane protein SusC